MSTRTLPDNPSLDHLREQARALQRAVHARDAHAAERVARRYNIDPDSHPSEFPLTTAQLVLAREYGFASWRRLKQYVDLVTDYRWDTSPAEVAENLATEFCRLACLRYHDDHPSHRARARQLLADHPGLTHEDVWAAVTAADVTTVERLLSARPELARTRGGPYGWCPLFYLVYSRVDPAVSADSVLAVARILLDAGADPDEGYLWNGELDVFTLLTGVFGEGELGPECQPRHPHSHAFARLLLDAGADPNDSQALYNRMFQPDNDHLELLLEYGLGSGDGGPWRRRASSPFVGVEAPSHRYGGSPLASPAALLRGQLRLAVEHGFDERVRLLARHGVDLSSAFDDGSTPSAVAQLHGHTAVVEFLVTQGLDTTTQ